MRPVLSLLILSALLPFAGATPPEPPPERYALELVRAPAAGEWGEVRGSFWREDGQAVSGRIALDAPDWIELAESSEWDARAPEGGNATHTWLVRPLREGLWSARIGHGPALVAWASQGDGGGYEELPQVLDVARSVELLDDGRVRVRVDAKPGGAWVDGTLSARLRPVGDSYDGSQDAYDGALRDGASLSVVLVPNASGRVSVQESFEPILRFDGPAVDTPYHVQSESYSRTYEVVGREVHEVDSYSTIIEGVPANAEPPARRVVPVPSPLPWVAAAILASRVRVE